MLLAMYKNGLIRKIILNSKFMTSRPGKQAIAIHKNVVDKLFLEPYLKNQNWSCLRTNSLKFYTLCLYCIPSWGPSKYIETKLQTTSLHLIYSKLFEKKVWNWFTCLIFRISFEEKCFNYKFSLKQIFIYFW